MDIAKELRRAGYISPPRDPADYSKMVSKKLLLDAADEIAGLREAIIDHKRLVRELDVALNGEDGAAPQASLCDIVGQVKDKRWKLVRTE